MYHKKVFVLIAFAVVILLAACGKASQPANPTLTFGNNTCAYSGPNSVHGGFTLDVILPEKNPLASAFALVTLQSGKTIADLNALPPSTDSPDWVNALDYQEYLTKTVSYTYGAGISSAYHPYDPLFLVCFQMDSKGNRNKIGAFGPIVVKE